jgi:hypothetical protein
MYYRSLNFARKKTIKLSTLKENNPCENLLCEIVKFWNQVVYANSRMIIKNRSKDNCVIRLFNMLHCINIRILILVLIYKTSLTSPLFIEVSVPSHERDLPVMYVCVSGIKLFWLSYDYLHIRLDSKILRFHTTNFPRGYFPLTLAI